MSNRIPESLTTTWVDRMLARYPTLLDAGPSATCFDYACLLSAAELRTAYHAARMPRGTTRRLSSTLAPADLMSPADVALCSRWSHYRKVYRFGADLARRLAQTEGTGDLPARDAARLRCPILCIQAPDLQIPDVVGGCANVREVVAWTDVCRRRGQPSLRLCALCEVSEERQPRRVHLQMPMFPGLTVGAYLANLREFVCVGGFPAPGTDHAELAAYRAFIARVLPLVAYLCSKGVDTRVAHTPRRRRGRAPSPATNPETVCTVGSRLGDALLGPGKPHWRRQLVTSHPVGEHEALTWVP